MTYTEAKTILTDKYKRRLLTQKQYFKLVSEARARFYQPDNDAPKPTLLDIFDGKLMF